MSLEKHFARSNNENEPDPCNTQSKHQHNQLLIENASHGKTAEDEQCCYAVSRSTTPVVASSDPKSISNDVRWWGPLDLDAMDIVCSFPDSHVGGSPRPHWVISEHFGKRALVEEFVELIQKHALPAWRVVPGPRGPVYQPTVIGGFCEPRLALLDDLDETSFPSQNRYSERFHVFLDACREVRQAGYTEFGSRCQDMVSLRLRYEAENVLVASIRAKTQTREFRDRARHRDNQVNCNLEAGLKFINDAFTLCSKLLVLRVDLHYFAGSDSSASADQLQADLLKFWRQRRHDADREVRSGKYRRDPFVGYIRIIEFGLTRHFHAHVLFFFNGHVVKDPYSHGEKMGALWQRVTAGRGTFHNCGHNWKGYKYPFLGVVDRRDEVKRSWILEHGVGYMAKDNRCSPIMTTGIRRFQTSQLREKSARGRRRLPDCELPTSVPLAAHRVAFHSPHRRREKRTRTARFKACTS
jgi:hypothetical protein